MAKFSVAIQSDAYKNLINSTLGDKEVARTFVAEISTVVSQNKLLASPDADAGTIISAGLLAQSLKMPLAPTLGFCYIVPYKDNKAGIINAQFQIGYKGLIQLAQRSGQFERLNVLPVHQSEYLGMDEDGEEQFKFDHKYDDEKVVGYRAFFKLNNGFKKSLYMTVEQLTKHAKRYSRSFGNNKGTDLWTSDFDIMASKTVLKLLLNRYAPLSIEMQKAILADQAVIKDDGTYDYVDNTPVEIEQKSDVVLPEVPSVKEQKVVEAEVISEQEELAF